MIRLVYKQRNYKNYGIDRVFSYICDGMLLAKSFSTVSVEVVSAGLEICSPAASCWTFSFSRLPVNSPRKSCSCFVNVLFS